MDEESREPLPPEIARAAVEALTRMANLMSRESDVCMHCGQPVTKLVQVGRCVHAEPCGCRLWQGTVPEAWRP